MKSEKSKPIYIESFGKNCVKNIVGRILLLQNFMQKDLKDNKNTTTDSMITKKLKQNEDFETCCFCDNPCKEEDEKLKHHCPVTGKHRGAAHTPCNLNPRRYNSSNIG